MSIAAIRTAIVAALNAVPGIGVVHAYERYATDLRALKDLYVPSGETQVRGWFVRRATTLEHAPRSYQSVEITDWHIRGFMSLDDSAQSQLAFEGLVEAIRGQFRTDDTLGGVVAQCSQPNSSESAEGWIQVRELGPVMFGGVLCHAARLGLTTVRYLEGNP